MARRTKQIHQAADEWCLPLKALVDAVYAYTVEDPGWCMQTKSAQEKRERMDHAARILGLKTIGRTFSREEIDVILGWEREA